MPGKIAVIGSNMVDLVSYVDRLPEAGETLEAPTFQMGCGGKGANQAVAAAKLGASVVMVTKIGSDIFGENTLRNLKQFGVDTTHVGVVQGESSGVAPIFVEPSGENRILIIKGANNRLLPADIDAAADDIRACRLIVLQLEVPLETVYYAIDFGHRHGIEVLLNTAPATKALDVSRLGTLGFLVANETELALLTDLPVNTPEEAEAAARTLIGRGIKTVIVTLGSKGALLVTADRTESVPAVAVAVRDTTGAGDAFIGCFARYYVDGVDLVVALTMASAYAADSITRPGTQIAYADAAGFAAFFKKVTV